jgi:hypothetical protein
VERFDVTPEQARRGRLVPDAALPMLAAQWLVEGYDSEGLRELAGLTRRDAVDARRMFSDVLGELGYPIPRTNSPWEDLPWRGHWDDIWWLVEQVDRTHTPYAAAQRVLEILSDVPELWEPGRGDRLQELVGGWRDWPDDRERLDAEIRTQLRSLAEDDVPPLRELAQG